MKSRFQITKLEQRIAPAPARVLIPSVDLTDPGVNGAEHACKGLMNNHNPHPKLGDVQLFRHGCLDGAVDKKGCGCG